MNSPKQKKIALFALSILMLSAVAASQYATTDIGYSFTISAGDSGIRFIGHDNGHDGVTLLRADDAQGNNLHLALGNWARGQTSTWTGAFGIVNENSLGTSINSISVSGSGSSYVYIWLHNNSDTEAVSDGGTLIFDGANGAQSFTWNMDSGNADATDANDISTPLNPLSHTRTLNATDDATSTDHVWLQLKLIIPQGASNGQFSGTFSFSFGEAETALTLTDPDGGESWEGGSEHNILWSGGDVSVDNVKLEYSKDDFASDVNTIVASTDNDGVYAWTVPNDASSTVRVRISDIEDATVNDTSNADLTILTQRTLTLTAPNGGESWEVTNSEDITWTSTGAISNVKLEYSKDDFASDVNTIVASTDDDGTYSWTIPDDVSSTVKVRVSDASTASINDTSNANFAIATLRTLTLTAPNGGESWEATTSHDITWTSTGDISNVKLEYSTDNFASDVNTIVASTADDGTYEWTIPEDPSVTVKVRISDASDSTVNDLSNSDLSLLTERTITLTDPNGGESWEATTSYDITWTSTGAISNVKLEYSKDNFASDVNTIVASTTNDGTHSWTIPNDPSTSVKVRISDASDAAVNDLSDADLTLLPDGLVSWWKLDESTGSSADDAVGSNDGTFTGADGGTINVRVSTANDDAEERTSGTVYLDSSDLELIDDSDYVGEQEVGMRFLNVAVPQGATISNAYIEFETDELDSVTTNLNFYAQDIDDAPAFSTTAFDITSRTKTSASVAWNSVPAWTTESEKHQTPDLSAIIQEVVDRTGWSSGNDMVIIVNGSGERTAEAYDGESANAPLLHFEYSLGGANWVTGKLNNGLDLDGVDDVVTVADAASLDLTSEVTLAAWIKADTGMSAGNIGNSVLDSMEFDTSDGRYPSIAHLSGDIYVIAYQSAGDGYLKTLDIDSDGTMGTAAIDTQLFDGTAVYPVILRVASTYVAVAYQGEGTDGWIKTYQIDSNGQITNTAVDSLEFDISDALTLDFIHVTGDYFAVAYQGDSDYGVLKTVEISTSGVITNTVVDTLNFETNKCINPYLVHVSGDYYAVAYQDTYGDGMLKTVTIDSSGLIGNSVIDSLEFELADFKFGDIVKVTGNYFAIAYRGPSDDGFLKTVEISTSGIIIDTVVDTLEFDTTEGREPRLIAISESAVAIAYKGDGGDGWLKTVEIDTSGQIAASAKDSLEFDTADNKWVDIIHITGDVFALAYQGNGDDGWLKTVSITTGYSSVASKAGAYGLGATSDTVFATINDQTISADITAGVWTHVVLTYNSTAGGTQEFKLYINGTLAASADYSESIATNSEALLIGNLLDGTLDEVRLYNDELTSSEVTALYDSYS